ncbi:MAG TPA: hypothetical protein PLN85_01535 [archaeon]|mgnify:FL=1|nr:hypothetical protein [archaeon]HRT02621.1 hypothetical protein [Candidatus Diapherotrites archaeon]
MKSDNTSICTFRNKKYVFLNQEALQNLNKKIQKEEKLYNQNPTIERLKSLSLLYNKRECLECRSKLVIGDFEKRVFFEKWD